ncbi:MAG: tRNA pseudouridine(38-40) synthase TruA [Oscillospiraceae bacterium]|nr:tRNA pseudouridine(38-40) synthase TruA [Oscillospiraceae bacterium]MBQ8978535.1 tRNA pseudouridine(38-40) synthase TruA [Oscillospiraceae bacterium]
MRNIRMMICYVGTAYHGFQRQNNARAVQNVIEDTLTQILGQQTLIAGCSRTDAGVHARQFCLSFRTHNPIPCGGLIRAMNSKLPGDIAVMGCEDAADDFHARYSCRGKEYEYLIHNADVRDPFLDNRALFYPYRMDTDRIGKAASFLEGRHDFTSFCGSDGMKEDNFRTVEYIRISSTDGMISVKIAADGFLYNMVRIIIGTLIEVNEGRMSPEDMPALLESKDRKLAGVTAPSHGLYLNKVFY